MPVLTVKILPAHREVLAAISKADQEPMAVIVRRLIREEAEKRGMWPNTPQVASNGRF